MITQETSLRPLHPSPNSTSAKAASANIQLLDGIRGAMALWVFFGHLQIYVSGVVPRFGHPASAVDVFMFLSGFLMAYHWIAREQSFPSFGAGVVDFYIRRFFRIAPLYYVLLFVALYWWPIFNAGGGAPSLGNIIAHATFAFALIPSLITSNILPDWSIGLEMQFYLAFPFLMVALRRIQPLTILFVVMAASVLMHDAFSLYDNAPKALGNFAQPGPLLFKLPVFMGGMCLARFFSAPSRAAAWHFLLIGAIAISWKTTIQFKGIVFVMTYLMCIDPQKLEFAHKALGGRLAKFLGDTSYSVYLIHMMVVTIVHNALLELAWFPLLSGALRTAITFAATAPVVYGLGVLAHRYIESTGISLGRSISKATRA